MPSFPANREHHKVEDLGRTRKVVFDQISGLEEFTFLCPPSTFPQTGWALPPLVRVPPNFFRHTGRAPSGSLTHCILRHFANVFPATVGTVFVEGNLEILAANQASAIEYGANFFFAS
jgi:hypothetical protein